MSFFLLFKDEFKGFYKSKVMIVLWFGMPLLTILMRLIQYLTVASGDITAAEIPLSLILMMVVSQIGGMLSSIMLSTSIVNELNKHVYDLFLIRPVKRYNLILAKYLAVLACLIIAILISLIIGIIYDISTDNLPATTEIWTDNIENFIVALANISISCCFGILIGISVKSVAAAAIISMYFGGQISSVIMLVIIMIEETYAILIATVIGVVVSTVLLGISILQFNKKQL
jgi:ABC-2 type transport system permease protein